MHIPVGEILRREMVAGRLGGLGEVEAACGHRNDKEAVARLGTLDDLRHLHLADDGGILDLRRDEQDGARRGWIGQNAAQLVFSRHRAKIANVLPGRDAVIVLRLDQQRGLVLGGIACS